VDHVDSTAAVVGLSGDLKKKNEKKKRRSVSAHRERERESTHIELLRRERSRFEVKLFPVLGFRSEIPVEELSSGGMSASEGVEGEDVTAALTRRKRMISFQARAGERNRGGRETHCSVEEAETVSVVG